MWSLRENNSLCARSSENVTLEKTQTFGQNVARLDDQLLLCATDLCITFQILGFVNLKFENKLAEASLSGDGSRSHPKLKFSYKEPYRLSHTPNRLSLVAIGTHTELAQGHEH